MNLLRCPFCGVRPLREFEFLKTLAGTNSYTGSDAVARVFERVDGNTESVEHWQHVGGCRAWLRLIRNPHSDCVLSAEIEGWTP